MTYDEILGEIVSGRLDEHLANLERAIKRRQSTRLRQFKPGDRVVMNDKCRPAYLQGLTATIVRVNQKRVIVNFDPGQNLGRFGSGQGISCPPELFDRLVKP